jgi:hypothetical protein
MDIKSKAIYIFTFRSLFCLCFFLPQGKCGPTIAPECTARELKDITCNFESCFNEDLVEATGQRILSPPDNFYFCFDLWLENDIASKVLVMGLPKVSARRQ